MRRGPDSSSKKSGGRYLEDALRTRFERQSSEEIVTRALKRSCDRRSAKEGDGRERGPARCREGMLWQEILQEVIGSRSEVARGGLQKLGRARRRLEKRP